MRTLPYDGPKIKRLRERAGLTLVELGAQVRRHPESLRHIERGTKNASVVTLGRIANALGVPLEEIATDDEDVPAAVA